MGKLRITGYRREHLDAVTHLQRLLWRGGREGNAAYLEWKYERNPYLDGRYLVLGWLGADLVGMVGAFGARWHIPEAGDVVLPCVADNVLEEEFRRGPWFGELMDGLVERLRADGVPWLLDFGDQTAAPALVMRGWRVVDVWPVGKLERARALGAGTRWSSDAPSERRGPSTALPIRLSRQLAPLEMAQLVAERPRSTRARHVHDARYLAWRYANPLARYFYLEARSSRLEGYLVAHRILDSDDDPTPTTIVECEARSDEVWNDLLEVAANELPGRTVLIWNRDLEAQRQRHLETLAFELDAPTGRLTTDWHLPHLMVHRVVEQQPSSPLAGLDDAAAWDLRFASARGWR